MSTFHNILQRSIVTFFILCFAFVSVYVPQSWNDIKRAEAGAVVGATFPQQLVDNVVHVKNLISTVASEAYGAITSFATNNMWIKEFSLDGLAWMLAKQIISQVTNSIVKWINSGFKGSPAFVQDLEGFLLNVGDVAFGKYLQDLKGPFSVVCSPFKLDVSIALALDYAQSGMRDGNKPACTLTGAMQNIDQFVAGNFNQGGWDTWFKITSNPTKYTDLGSVLQAKTDASIKIANAKGEEQKILDFGKGFMSSKVCETIESRNGPEEVCSVVTPGEVINKALTNQLDKGQQSLVAADEIDEIIGALLGQIGKQALTGAAGLLGLSGGTGYTAPNYTGGSYVAELSSPASNLNLNANDFFVRIQDSLNTEIRYKNAAENYLPRLTAFAANILNTKVDAGRRQAAQDEADAILILLPVINANIIALNNIINSYNLLPADSKNDSVAQSAERANLIQDYLDLRNLHSIQEVNGAEARWRALLL